MTTEAMAAATDRAAWSRLDEWLGFAKGSPDSIRAHVPGKESRPMRPRAPRRKVLVGARMRQSAGWDEVQILDLSIRGMQIRAPVPPPKGSYVEVQRGHHVIVGRVVWTSGGRAGVSTQDPLPIEAIAGDLQQPPADGEDPAETAAVSMRSLELRCRASERSHERSQWQARAMQVAWLAVIGGAAAVTVFGAVQQVFSTPLSQAAAAFADR